MKRFILFPLLFAALISCKKNKAPRAPSLAGTWEIRYHSSQQGTRTYLPGNDTIVKFTANTYEYYRDGLRTANGIYRTMVINADNAYKANKMIYDNNSDAGGYIYKIDSNKLTLNPGGVHTWGFTIVYERIN